MKSTCNQIFLSIALFTASLVLFSACRKNPEEIAELITESEAAEIVETAVAERSAGFTMPVIDMAEILENYLANCGTPGDTLLQKSKTGSLASYTYTFGMEWLVNCNALGIPLNATTSIAGNGSFTTPRWTGSDATTGNLTFTGLDGQSAAYIVNGSYSLAGDITGALRNVSPTFNCKTQLTLNNMTIDKTSYAITGGTGTAVVTGTTGNGNTKTITGNLTFNGNGTVTVDVNGYVHTFQLQ